MGGGEEMLSFVGMQAGLLEPFDITTSTLLHSGIPYLRIHYFDEDTTGVKIHFHFGWLQGK